MNGVATVAQLRELLRASTSTSIVHHPSCARATGYRHSPTVALLDDPRYWRGELRPCKSCAPVMPRPDAPPNEPGYLHAWRPAA
jgi:hypothetical protein